MPTGLDLHLSPLYRQNGQELPSLPGLLAMTPPRHTARGREQDRLVVYLALTGNTTLSTAEYMQMASQAAAQFYQTPGSLTYAMRTAGDVLNRALLERNLRTTGHGQFAIGWLVLGALRGAQMFLLLSGPTHAFVLNQTGVRHVHDPALSGRGMGLSQTLTTYFAQVELQAGDRLLFCAQMPAAWESALLASRSLEALEAARRRLMALADADTSAVLMQVDSGSGQVSVIKPARPDMAAGSVTATETTPTGSVPELLAEPVPEAGPPERIAQPSAYAIPPQREDLVTINKHPQRPLNLEDFPAPAGKTQAPVSDEDDAPEIAEVQAHPPRRPGEGTRQAARVAVSGIQTWRRMTAAIGTSFRKLLPLLLPGSDPQAPVRLPAWWMAVVAVAVPLVVVTVASLVYFRFGSGLQYQEFYSQAEAEAMRAASEGDPVRQREAWQQTLLLLEQVERYRTTDESQALRQKAQSSLDNLLGIIRLDFQPAISGGLDRSVRVDRLAATDVDLYMLDREAGKVFHAALNGPNYQLDAQFQCQEGIYGGVRVDTLVDIFALPRPNPTGASVVAVDTAGNLLYCGLTQDSTAVSLPPPDTNWNSVTAVWLDGSLLYVLDAGANAVWVYAGKDGAFTERPLFFFGDQVPSLAGAVDLATNGDDLYLLHEDGYLITCAYSRLASVPTRCQEPARLVDPHPASQGSDPFKSADFTQLLFAPPPDSSLLLLDEANQVTYRFSPRALELQNQLRSLPDNKLPLTSVSAMTMNSGHVLFLAFENKVYFAINVP